jgi:hypothetical protein
MSDGNECRCVVQIIGDIIKVIPKEENKLINELEEYGNSCWNKAPEVRRSGYCWNPLQQILQKYITQIDTEWKKNIVNIFNNTA